MVNLFLKFRFLYVPFLLFLMLLPGIFGIKLYNDGYISANVIPFFIFFGIILVIVFDAYLLNQRVKQPDYDPWNDI